MMRAALVFILALGAVRAAAAQTDSTALATSVAPDTVTVGERFRVTVALSRPGAWLELLPPADTERVRMVERTRASPDSAGRLQATATLVAWRTGAADSVAALARIGAADGSQRTISLHLPLPAVRSVLPTDPSRQVPRGPKDVWGPGRDWRAIAVLAVLAAILLFLFIRWIVRRRRRGGAAGTPREQALALLDQAEGSGLVEAGDWRAFYTLISTALRGYAAAVDARWSEDLTSFELLVGMREHRASAEHVATLAMLLRDADLAKFARHPSSPDEARGDLAQARQWVESFPPAVDDEEGSEEAAA